MMQYALLSLFLAIGGFAQEASDYYNKPVQEVREKAGICWDTTVTHKSGYKQCYQEISHWVRENRDKYDFLSVAFNKDSGVVQIALLSDCQVLRSGKVTEYYMVLTSHSDSFKIAFENIRPRSKECRAGLRNCMKSEIIHAISSLPDSLWWDANTGHPIRGLGYPECSATAHVDSVTDRLFALMKADSIRVTDSIACVSRQSDSIAKADSLAQLNSEAAIDTIGIQKEIDSISTVVNADSITIYRRDLVIFKNQPILQDKKRSIETRLDCLEFLLLHKSRPDTVVAEYLTALKKYCLDKQSLYYSVRKIIAAKDKFACTQYFKKAQTNGTQVQSFLDRLAKE